MPFDVEGARKSGYGDSEIADFLAKDSNFDTASARKAGYTDAELITHLRPKVESFNAQPTERQQLLSSVPMRVAKGGKDQIDGAAQLMQKVFEKDLVSRVSNYFGGPSVSDVVNKAADKIGGPGSFLGDVLGVKGANSEQLRGDIVDSNAEYEAARKATAPASLTTLVTGEKDPGFDFARLAGNIASPANVIPAKVAPAAAIGATVGRQALTGAIAGGAGAALQPSTGENFAADKAGQVALGAAAGGTLAPIINKIGTSAANFINQWRNSRNTVNVDPERLRTMISAQLQRDGIDTTTIPDTVFQGLTTDVRTALASGRKLDPTAALRQGDFNALGLPSLQGQLTRNPAQWQREFNLAGVEGVGEPLQAVQAAQSRGISDRFRQGARGAVDAFDAGDQIAGQLRQADEVAKTNVRAAYKAFRDSTGKDLEVPLQGLAQDYANTVRDYGQAIPGAVRGQFEELGLMGGKQLKSLSIDDAERLLKVINKHYNSPDPAVRGGLDELRGSLQRAITESADTSAGGAEAAHLASEARAAAASRFQQIGATPALRAATNNAQPDDFVRKFVTGGKVNEIQNMMSLLPPDGQAQVRAQTVAYLQQKAFGANAAGDGKAAQATFNNELMKIGRPKLVALLGEEGADEMYRIGRVLAYIKQVPEGATPNTSGTGQMLTSMLGKTKGLRGLPYVNDYVVQPLERFGQRREVTQALSGAPTQPTEIDPKLVQALSSLFAPVPVAAGVATGQMRR